MNNIMKLWLENENTPADIKNELLNLTDEKIIEDSFYKNLEFGTAGLRGKMGAGTNRMNSLTVGKATQGLADYLKDNFQKPAVCIAYDTRNNSDKFAREISSILIANNITTYLFDTIKPTPMLSFAVRLKKANAGIVITASHNPKEYNGYKVYGESGGQITDLKAAEILSYIDKCDIFNDIKTMDFEVAVQSDLFHFMGEEVDKIYFENVKSLTTRKDLIAENADKLSIVYTPIHGTGNLPVRRVLKELGFSDVNIIKEQELPDGNFPTAPYPNPEFPEVFPLAIKKALEINADIIIGTDPDCDRIGVLAKNKNGEFIHLSGNQTGALITDYIIKSKKTLNVMPKNPAVIKTVVTSNLPAKICTDNDVAIYETLTGFKYICELAEDWYITKDNSFLFGFEESFGYTCGDFIRDKDAVVATTLICEMALYYKTKNLSLVDALENLYEEYGYYFEKNFAIVLEGIEGSKKIKALMEDLRADYKNIFKNEKISYMEDYKISKRTFFDTWEEEKILLPTSNVLKFFFDDGSFIAIRPSGTEPKIKFYICVNSNSKEKSTERLAELVNLAENITK